MTLWDGFLTKGKEGSGGLRPIVTRNLPGSPPHSTASLPPAPSQAPKRQDLSAPTRAEPPRRPSSPHRSLPYPPPPAPAAPLAQAPPPAPTRPTPAPVAETKKEVPVPAAKPVRPAPLSPLPVQSPALAHGAPPLDPPKNPLPPICAGRPGEDLKYLRRGLLFQIRGDHASAVQDFTRALEIDPHCVEAYSNRGISREQMGDLAGARADYARSIEIEVRAEIDRQRRENAPIAV